MAKNVYNFPTDKINIYSLILDCSGSMECNEERMKKSLKLYKDSFEGFSEAESMAIAVNRFDGEYYSAFFESTKDFNIDYKSTGGATAIYYAICQAKEQVFEYMKKVVEENNCKPRVTFIVFSDGEPYGDLCSKDEAKEVIRDLNYAGVDTVFVAFGNSISSKFGEELGFKAIKDVEDDEETLERFMGEELSRSCKEQSQSLRSLGANFFSKACRDGNSEKYSQKTQQVLDDEDWLDNI